MVYKSHKTKKNKIMISILTVANKTVDVLKCSVRSALDQNNSQFSFEMVAILFNNEDRVLNIYKHIINLLYLRKLCLTRTSKPRSKVFTIVRIIILNT